MQKKPRLYLIDGSSYIYRAFFALPRLSNSKGLPTNAVYGFARMLSKIIKDEKPDYLAVVFDSKGETFRHREYAEYKSHRPEMPDELVPQIPYIRQLVEAFNISILQKEGYEADDLIGTAVNAAENKGFDITIVSGDKDMLQLITSNVRMLDTLKNKAYKENEVIEKFGVGPDKVVEVIGLMGDSSDNIPGVPGIGEKTAISLIKEFGSIENLLKNLDKVSKPSLREKLKSHTDQAMLSRRLAVINRDIELDKPIEELTLKDVHNDKLTALLSELEFSTLLKDMTAGEGQEAVFTLPANGNYRIIGDKNDFEEFLKRIESSNAMALCVAATHEEPMRAEITGISISLKPNEAVYIPLIGASEQSTPPFPSLQRRGERGGQLDKEYVLKGLKPFLENGRIKKYGHDIKYDAIVLSKEGLDLKGIEFDTLIASYLINPSEIKGQGSVIQDSRFNDPSTGWVPQDSRLETCNLQLATSTAYQSKEKLEAALKEDGLFELYRNVEMPLIEVLSEMERDGVKIDEPFLRDMSKRLETGLNRLIEKIYFIAGIEFNINSPKQLQEVLFERLKLKSAKRTKTGMSTDVEVLQQLSSQHELPALILEYRQLSKLKSTYIDALPELINAKTGRVHTSFNQAVTATGRLSSSNPNLQNIPIRTELGREIRKAFISENGCMLLSADYSQIELRILAHISQDDVLIDAFKKGEDIHERTACEVFGVLPGTVTQEMRRMAKTVNFGVIYGISPFGLSKDLGISTESAKEFIDNYFIQHKGVKEYIEKNLKEAYEKGYVTTILQRRRYLPDLKSSNRQTKEFGKRTAINTVIQGSAADMIKVAMINIHRRLKTEGRKAKMLIQVHDELVFEAAEDEIDVIKKLVKEEMEGVMKLSVPIVVEIHTGKNWNEAH
jgi:DNA polymerase-1